MWDTAGEEDELINDIISWTPKHRYASVDRPARTYLH